MAFAQKASGISVAALLMLSAVAAVMGLSNTHSAYATFPGKNGRIVYASYRDGHSQIYAMNSDGTGQTRLTNDVANDSQPRWSPDNTKIAFVSDRDANHQTTQIYVMNADGTNQVNVSKNITEHDLGPAWSPDGTKIAFSRAGTLYVMNAADGSGQKMLIEDGETPSWSPDGKKIVFISGSYGNGISRIHIMNADGTLPVRLDYDPKSLQFPGPYPPNNPIHIGSESWPHWSPDGKKITFTADEVGPSIYSINVDGTGLRRLDGQWDLLSTWSPDGTKAVFTKSASGPNPSDYEIYTIAADGNRNTLARLTSNNVQDEFPDWGSAPDIPDSSKYELTLHAVDLNNNQLNGMWMTVTSINGTLVKSGFSPLTFFGNAGLYKISAANYDGKTFYYWKNGVIDSPSNTFIVSLVSNLTLTATYKVGLSVRGFTPLTFTNPPPNQEGIPKRPDLTVNALTVNGNRTVNMWTIIDSQQSTNSSEATYKVYATNGYRNLVFDHWRDNGNTDRIRTLTIAKDTTITAYYREE